MKLTKQGINNLTNELNTLKEQRLENIKEIQEARQLGDLSENADYDAAKNRQAQIHTRITEIEYILKNAEEITITNPSVIQEGVKIIVNFLHKKRINEYLIVNTIESNPAINQISIDSPLVQALLNSKVNDIVKVKTLTNTFEVKLLGTH